MRVIFAGTPDFAAQALQAIVEAGFEVLAVLTQPDRPAGRGMQLQASAVKQFALAQGLPVWQPLSLKDASIQADLAALQADVMVVAAYGLLLPQAVLNLPQYGCINIHASLLPRWRGAAPIHRAIEAGDTETGITIMQMDQGLDTGAMLDVARLPIDAEANTASLLADLASLGAARCVAVLQQLQQQKHGLLAVQQPEVGVTYAHKLNKAEAELDWSLPAEVLARKVRAFNPFPTAFCRRGSQTLKIWAARVVSNTQNLPIGQVFSSEEAVFCVACAEQALALEVLQIAGGKRLHAAAFVQGHPILLNECLPLVSSSNSSES